MEPQYAIRVENSAPSQGRPARSVSWASPLLAEAGVQSVVDLGCGRLRNLGVMREWFANITLVDTEPQCKKISSLVPEDEAIRLVAVDEFKAEEREYGAFFLICVLHIIDQPSVREELLRLAESKLREGGFLVVDVPAGEHYYRQRCGEDNKHGDGWAMGKGSSRTFYKNYRAHELDDLVTSCTSFGLYKKTYFDKHLTRIWQKPV